MKFKQANTHTIQCMGQNINLKSERKNPFSAHTINCVCHSIRSMFRLLGIYNFALKYKKNATVLCLKYFERIELLAMPCKYIKSVNAKENYSCHFVNGMYGDRIVPVRFSIHFLGNVKFFQSFLSLSHLYQIYFSYEVVF